MKGKGDEEWEDGRERGGVKVETELKVQIMHEGERRGQRW